MSGTETYKYTGFIRFKYISIYLYLHIHIYIFDVMNTDTKQQCCLTARTQALELDNFHLNLELTTNCVILGKFYHNSVPRIPHL